MDPPDGQNPVLDSGGSQQKGAGSVFQGGGSQITGGGSESRGGAEIRLDPSNLTPVLGKLITSMCLCHQAVKLGTGRRTVTFFVWEGLVESNGSLSPGMT